MSEGHDSIPHRDEEFPTWLQDASSDFKDWFRMMRAQVRNYQESLREDADHIREAVEQAESPGKRRAIILAAMVMQQFERDRMYLFIRPDPAKSPDELMREANDLERKN